MKRYILVDNEIIDTEKYFIDYEYGRIRIFDNDELKYKFRQYDIEQESDNLMDLIKVGDIILFKLRLDANFYGTVSLVFKNKCFVKCLPIDIYEESILKIFKPNNDNKHSLAWQREEG